MRTTFPNSLRTPRASTLERWRSVDAGPTEIEPKYVDVPALNLYLDSRSNHVFSRERVSSLAFEVSSEVTARAAAFAARHGFTESDVYAAAFALLLSRYANATEVPVGLPAAWIDGVGASATTEAVLLAACNPEQSFAEFTRFTGKRMREGHCVKKGENSGAAAGFASFWCEAAGMAEASGDAAMQRPDPEIALGSCAPFDILFRLQPAGRQWRTSLLYRNDRFRRETIQRLSRHFNRLLEDCTARPAAPLAEFEIMPVDERSEVLKAASSDGAEFPRLCLHELFAEHAVLRPESLAVVFGDTRLTYRELDQRSNRIAQFLRREAIQPEDRIGIFMERSADMIVAILGVLKAGGIYVPIDPDYPEERLRFLAEDAAFRLVLTHSLVNLELPSAAPKVSIDHPDSPVHSSSSDAVPNWSTPESIAVLIYTSGSTGQPKGACIPHRAAVRTVRSTNFVEATPADRVAQAGSPSFDAAITEIWLALTNGAALVGVPRHTLLDPRELQRLIDKESISILVLNTSYVHQIGLDAPECLSKVRKVLFGGEAAEPGPLRLLLKHLKPGVLVNGYGPAEGCVITTYHDICSIPEDAASVPIGRPVSHARVYLLDLMGRLVPAGVPGEIYIGGHGVARGYWNRPELTPQRFVRDTFSGREGGLLYRTGDLARLRSDGSFEFLGRVDEQVKIRGHRIELAEVRHALMQHPAVKKVFLMVREDQPGDRRLVAYTTLRHPLDKAEEELRLHAKSKLPSHMLPAAFVVMESIPLNTNGKVDRKALPVPNQRPESSRVFEAAATDLERRLGCIWTELLGVGTIGIHDSFFDLGGHSLLAARLIARIEKDLGRNIPVAALFEAPTIYQLARKLAGNDCEAAWSPLVELRPAASRNACQPFFCVHSLGANLASQHKIAALFEGSRAVYGLQPHGLDGKQVPLESVEAMARSYIEQIRGVQPAGPYYLGGICLGGVVAYEMARQLTASGETVALVALIDSFMPGDSQPLHRRPELIEYLDCHIGEMLLLPGFKRVSYLLRWLANGGIRMRNALGFGERSSLARATRRIAQAHLKAIRNYEPEPYSGKVVQLMCSDAPHRTYEDRRLAWSALTSSGFEVQLVPGNHLNMVEEPHVRVLAQELEIRLRRASGDDVERPSRLGYGASPPAKVPVSDSQNPVPRSREFSAAVPQSM